MRCTGRGNKFVKISAIELLRNGRPLSSLSMARAARLFLPLMLSCANVWAQPAAQNAVPGASGTGYVGNDVCKTCHADIWSNFYKNPHFKSIAMGKTPPERTGCEGCHGPAKAHVEAGGGKATIPHAFSLMQPAAVLEDCLTCHAKDLSKSNIWRSELTRSTALPAPAAIPFTIRLRLSSSWSRSRTKPAMDVMPASAHSSTCLRTIG